MLQGSGLQIRGRRFTQSDRMKNVAHKLPLMELLPPSSCPFFMSAVSQDTNIYINTASSLQVWLQCWFFIPESSHSPHPDLSFTPLIFHDWNCLLPPSPSGRLAGDGSLLNPLQQRVLQIYAPFSSQKSPASYLSHIINNICQTTVLIMQVVSCF